MGAGFMAIKVQGDGWSAMLPFGIGGFHEALAVVKATPGTSRPRFDGAAKTWHVSCTEDEFRAHVGENDADATVSGRDWAAIKSELHARCLAFVRGDEAKARLLVSRIESDTLDFIPFKSSAFRAQADAIAAWYDAAVVALGEAESEAEHAAFMKRVRDGYYA